MQGALHQRFNTSPLAEEVDALGETAANEQLRAEKARMYDRAFQQSTLLSSTAGSPPRAGPIGHAGRSSHGVPSADCIQEESALDGDVFVAPTDAQPFGLPSDDEDGSREAQMGAAAASRDSFGGLVGDLYRR